MFFQLWSDIHTEHRDGSNAYPEFPSYTDTLFLAGDIGYPETIDYQEFMRKISEKFDRVFYTLGNHEYDQDWKSDPMSIRDIQDFVQEILPDNIILLNNQDSVIHQGHRIVGRTLWVDVPRENEKFIQGKLNDYRRIWSDRGQINTVKRARQRNHSDFRHIQKVVEKSEEPVIVVTHHPPSPQSIPEKYNKPDNQILNSGYVNQLEDWIQDHPQIRIWMCGHCHDPMMYPIGETMVIMNPVGYPDETTPDVLKDRLHKVYELTNDAPLMGSSLLDR